MVTVVMQGSSGAAFLVRSAPLPQYTRTAHAPLGKRGETACERLAM